MKETLVLTLAELTKRQIEMCVRTTHNGIKVHTPSGSPEYASAFFHRDFDYMLEGAPEFFNAGEVRQELELALENTREDGWIVDHVERESGDVGYRAGTKDLFCGYDNLDTATIMARAFSHMIDMLEPSEAEEFYRKWESTVCRGLDILPRSQDGLVWNDPDMPHTAFGFTDIVAKTGKTLMDSLELWRAYRCMIRLKKKYSDDSGGYETEAQRIEEALLPAFLRDDGMLNAATEDCRQTDIWGSAYAVAIGFPMEPQHKKGICDWIAAHYEEIAQHGHFRHLPAGEYWQRLQIPYERDQYMDGGYWSMPSGWIAQALYFEYPELVQRILSEACEFFSSEGVYECINGDWKKGANYPVSIAGVYAAAKHLLGGGINIYQYGL